MNNLNVLHLSDLHLKYDNEVDFNSFWENMKDCIEKIDVPIHLITITGDLVDKGNVSDFAKFYEKFLKPLSKVSKCPESNIFCVPGNHDAERDSNIFDMRQQFDKDSNSGSHFRIKKSEIRKVISRFEDFDEFNKLLHPSSTTQKGYGVEFVTVSDINVALVQINSAIYSHDEQDYQKLGLSKVQLDDLVKQYKLIKDNNNIDITIALMHHPDDWLRKDEKEHMWSYFSSKDKLPIDIVLHGHTHESKIAGKIDLDSFVLSLVTGTTYELGNKETSVFNSCRFALYSFDINNNEIQGKLYITNSKGKFVPDTSSYNSVNNDGCFCIPYNQRAFQNKNNVCRLPVPIDNHVMINEEYIKLFNDMVARMWDFEKACRRQLDAFSSVPKTEFERNNSAVIKDWFMNIASCARTCLFDESEVGNVRAHFRTFHDNKHIHFCATLGERQITPIEWNSGNNLIFHAYDQKRSLVKSSNPNIYFDTNGEWDDFLTVPIFEKYNGNEIPTYSFGISIKGTSKEVLSKKLEILSFMRIESLIDSMYASFRRRYLT